MADLSERDRAILDLEGEQFVAPSAKLAVIRERFGLSGTAYHQVLNALLDTESALAYAPSTVNRLRRLRQARSLGR